MKLENLEGRWVNSKKKTSGIEEFEFSIKGEDLIIKITGSATGPLTGEWKAHKVKCYGNMAQPEAFSGFQLTLASHGIDIVLAGNINKGLIIIAMYGVPTSSAEISNFFLREFFYQVN